MDKRLKELWNKANVVERHAWVKQILHVVAYGPMHAVRMDLAAAEELADELMSLIRIAHREAARCS